MHLKAQVRCLSKRKSLLVGSFVVDCRWSKGSLIQFLLGINTLMNSFRNVFLLFKKNFHQRHKSAKGKALKRDDYHLSNTFLPRTEELRYLSHVHNREVSKLKRDLTKGRLLWGISSERDKPGSPQQMGALSWPPQGGKSPRREKRDHKKGWRHGWTVTHVPLWRGDFIHLAFGVSSCYQSCHEPPPCPPALHCSVLHVDKWIKEER